MVKSSCSSRRARCLATSLVVLAGAGGAPAATIHVPADHPTVQAGVLAAEAGDTVLVAPGTYTELIRMRAGVVLKSAEGPDSTILVSPGIAEQLIDERLIECLEGDQSTLIEGFTMTISTMAGCAVYVENASPTIRGNVIDGFGWGIHLRFSEAVVEDNEIRNSRTFGILCFASSPKIFRNSLHDNAPQAISISGKESHPVIGGSAENANKLFGNQIAILNGSRNDIDATWNDWGWETTTEMDSEGYPSDIVVIRDGNDRHRSHRGKGKVDYQNWIRPDDAETAAPGATPLARVALPVALALVLIAAFVGFSRRRSPTAPG